jgi:hypothetical protein
LDEQAILPSHPKRLVWDVLALLGVLYYLFVVPLRIAFPFPDTKFDDASLQLTQHYLYSLMIDEAWDLFFLVDMFLRFRYFAVKDPTADGVYLTDPEDIQHAYRSWGGGFYFDLIASLPFDLLALGSSIRLFLWLRYASLCCCRWLAHS